MLFRRHFHVVVVQWRQRNEQKSVMHEQSCCFTLNLFSFAVLVADAVVVAQATYFASAKRFVLF